MIGISLSGMRAATTRLTASASNVANVASQDYRPVRAAQSETPGGGTAAQIATSGAPEVDLTDEMVQALVAKIAFQANARMIETAHDLDRGIFERLA